MTKRTYLISLLFTLIFGIVIAKMAWTQLYNGSEYATRSFNSRSNTISLEAHPRGDILDRYGQSLLVSDYQPALIILPKQASDPALLLDQCQQYLPQLSVTAEQILPKTTNGNCYYPEPLIYPIEDYNLITAIKQIDNPAMIIAPYKNRYSDQSLARHLIGYVDNQGHGLKGIEKRYDDQLFRQDPQRLLAPMTDANNRLLPGLGYRLVENPSESARYDIWLTLDKTIQQSLEQIFDRNYVLKGAAIVLDTETGQILAAVSRPNYDPNNLTETYGFNDNQLERTLGIDYNYYPGSTFKLVTGLIALEEGVATQNTTFTCNNQPPYNKCPREHGTIDFSQALKVSCNNYFIQLGQKIGQKTLQDYLINKLHFTLEPGKKLDSFSARANGVIGQELFKVSPLQMANIAAMIANDGQYLPVDNPIENRLVLGYAPHGQFPQDQLKNPYSKAIFSTNRTKSLQQMLKVTETVTVNGVSQTISYAGKTGTPEVYSKTNEKAYMAWYTGYTPFDHPRYAVAIVIEDIAGLSPNQLSGGKHALPIFKQLAFFLSAYESDKEVHR